MRRLLIISVSLVSLRICLFGQTHWPLKPLNESHQLFKTYGDWNGFTVYQTSAEGQLGYHGGVDIPTSFGTPIYAVEACSTRGHFPDTFPCGGDSGWICLSKTMSDYTAWHYGHIDSVPRELWIQPYGVAVADSQKIGVVAQFHNPDIGDHLHFARTKAWYDTVNAYTNPLAYLSPSPFQIPRIDQRLGTPHHPYKIYYVKDKLESITNSYETTYLRDSVDIIVKAHTDVELDPRCGVYAIGYGVQPLTAGGSIPFRKMFEMRDTIKVLDSLKYYITYADTGADTLSRHFNNWYIVTNCGDSVPQPGYGLSNIKENCWPTKINIAGTVNADSIEDARFPDGYYITTIKVWSHSGDSAVALDTVLVDNFPPRVKKTYPDNWYRWIVKDEKEVWCIFSEAMDTTTLTTTNIKIRSLVDTTYYYSIKKITYIDSLFKLILEVDSFRFHDEVQVWLSDSIKDLAGKALTPGGGKNPASYTWKFTVGVIKLTDNDLMDIRPDIYGDKIAWVEVLSSTTGNIKLHDLTSHSTLTLNTTTGLHNWPIVWKGQVAWRQEIAGSPYYRDRIYYFNGDSTQLIVSENLARNQYDFDSCGIVMYSTVRDDGGYPDTIWVQYYQIGTGLLLLDKYTVKDNFSRNVDIDGNMIVWEHGKTAKDGGFGGNSVPLLQYERGFKNDRRNLRSLGDNRAVYTKDIYLRGDFGVWNLTSFMDSSINAMPSLSQGQSTWLRYTWNKDTSAIAVWKYDAAGSWQLSSLLPTYYGIYWPEIQNGDVVWFDYNGITGAQRLHYYDGWQDNILATGYSLYDFVFWNWQVENNQGVWLQLGTVHNPIYYNGEQIIKLVDRGSDSYRIGIDNGFVIYDAWDGHDNEIYLYIGDTLKTPPVVVKNLQGEVLGSKSPAKKVKLTWRANTEPDLAGYKIYRSSTPYQYSTTPYATILAPETTFIDTLPLEGMNYYVATAYDNLNNESGFSNQVSVFIDNIPPAVPANLVASYDSINQKVSLIWRSSPDADLKLYKIYRSETSGSYTLPLDSVFKPDTTFIDSMISLGKTYYYVVSAVDTNKNESGFSNEDTVIVPFFIASDFALATAYNTGHKIMSNEVGKEIHFVYANEGWLMPAGIYYCYSSDSGRSFSASEYISGPGIYPALGIDPYGNPCASWVSGSSIYFTYWTSSWAPPDTIVLPVENVSPPSMVCDDIDTVHLVYVQYHQLPSDIGDLVYLKFNRTDFEGAVIETLYHNIFCQTPSLTLDELRNIHFLWQGERCICYQSKDSTGWLGIDTIYKTTTSEKLYPVIDLYGNKIMVCWQDKDSSGNLEIYSRHKTDIGWQEIKKVATTSGESRFPTLAGAHYCLWQDNSSGNWEVYKSQYVDTLGSWTVPENISNTLPTSGYPHCVYSLVNPASAKLYSLWTEGDTIPYTIKFKKLDASPVAKIFVDLGQPVQSPYTLKRDGYWIFGDKPYQTTDWGYENLRYWFSGLDPQKDYRLDLAYYFRNEAIEGNSGQLEIKGESRVIKGNQVLSGNDEYRIEVSTLERNKDEMLKLETLNLIQGKVQHDKYEPERPDRPEKLNRPEGIGRIIQALVVDGVGLDTAFITPNHLKRISVWLPKSVYTDGEVIIEIKKIKGKRVVCSEIGLYEFPQEKKGKIASGPQGEETSIARPFVLERIYPNPAKNALKIRFNSPDSRKVAIKLYDVTGRLVQKVLFPAEVGSNEFLLIPKGLSSGVYFLETETGDYKKVKKVVLIKE